MNSQISRKPWTLKHHISKIIKSPVAEQDCCSPFMKYVVLKEQKGFNIWFIKSIAFMRTKIQANTSMIHVSHTRNFQEDKWLVVPIREAAGVTQISGSRTFTTITWRSHCFISLLFHLCVVKRKPDIDGIVGKWQVKEEAFLDLLSLCGVW